jgi:hypothetical protein
MPALDACHPHIIHALEKDGWRVSEKPLKLDTARRSIYIDIEAARGANGIRQQILLGEVKCFPDRDSTTRDLYIAVGQSIIYRAVLDEMDIHTPLYLAIPQDVYQDIFDSTVRRAISDNKIKVLVVNVEMETIVQWID